MKVFKKTVNYEVNWRGLLWKSQELLKIATNTEQKSISVIKMAKISQKVLHCYCLDRNMFLIFHPTSIYFWKVISRKNENQHKWKQWRHPEFYFRGAKHTLPNIGGAYHEFTVINLKYYRCWMEEYSSIFVEHCKFRFVAAKA